MDQIDKIIASGAYHDIFSIIKGFRNGAVYGAKIRFPHALVMTFLFKRSDLAFFVSIFKALLLLQKRLKGKEHHLDSFVAGIIGGYLIFGTDNPVNQQIVLYLFSRISTGIAKLAVKKGYVNAPERSFSAFAAITWGVVMWLFRNHQDTLQGGLQTSMIYLYNDSDVFKNLKTLLWKNK